MGIFTATSGADDERGPEEAKKKSGDGGNAAHKAKSAQDRDIAARTLEQVDELPPIAQVERNDDQHSRERGHRDERGEFPDEEEHREQKQTVNDRRNRRFGNGLNIRRRPRDSTCRRYAAEDSRHDI